VKGLLVVAAVVGCVVCAESTALAYRPFDGTDADVAAFGDFELELGPVHYYSQADSRYVIVPATVLNLGFARRWELVVDFQNFIQQDPPLGQPRDRLLDTDVFAKTVLVPGSLQDAGRGPSVALEFGPLLPNINGAESFGASCNLIVSQRWDALTLHSDSWLELTRGDLHADWFEGLIVEGPFAAPVRPVSELFVEHEWVADVTTLSALVGGIWRASEGIEVDGAVREARIGEQWATEVRLGFTWTLGVWKPLNEEKRGHRPGTILARSL
jgi:hypothetical protein